MLDDELLTRRNLRHALIRAHNARVLADRTAVWPPTMLKMSPDTLAELLTDGDPDEHWTLDFEGMRFMDVDVVVDPRLAKGDFEVVWSTSKVSPS